MREFRSVNPAPHRKRCCPDAHLPCCYFPPKCCCDCAPCPPCPNRCCPTPRSHRPLIEIDASRVDELLCCLMVLPPGAEVDLSCLPGWWTPHDAHTPDSGCGVVDLARLLHDLGYGCRARLLSVPEIRRLRRRFRCDVPC